MKVVAILGVSGATKSNELVNLTIENVQRFGNVILVKIPDANKMHVPKTFTIEGEFADVVRRYIDLRPLKTSTNRFFVNYQKGKCTVQPIGTNKIAKIPKEIATFLKLAEPERYTAHSFRRTSTLLADN